MASSLGGLSASVTRILFLTGFNKELKTKDIQSAFGDFEAVNGGFKIKWRDDTSLLVVFNDATVAKRAYLHTLAFPPAILATPAGSATIRPYDGPDAQQVIQNVNARTHNHTASRAHNGRSASISVFNPPSVSTNGNNGTNRQRAANPSLSHIAVQQYPAARDREPSPTLPDIPSHPTLNSLINSSLTDAVANQHHVPTADPAILATSLTDPSGAPPKIGDPGKRIIGAALGVRHPGLPPRVIGPDATKPMGGLVVAE